MVVLNSKEIAREFIAENNLMPILFESRWDASASGWKSGEAPDEREAVDFFDEEIRQIVEDNRRGNIRVGIKWKDPELAATWANALVKLVNSKLRDRALREATHNVAFLKEQIATTDMPVLQQSLARAVESELQKVMIASVGEEYAFKVVDWASAPLHRYSPRRLLLVIVALLLGGATGVAIVLIRNRLSVLGRLASDSRN